MRGSFFFILLLGFGLFALHASDVFEGTQNRHVRNLLEKRKIAKNQESEEVLPQKEPEELLRRWSNQFEGAYPDVWNKLRKIPAFHVYETFLRELVVPWDSINEFADFLNQVQRSSYMTCPNNQLRQGLTCWDPGWDTRETLDGYFCGTGNNPAPYGGLCDGFYKVLQNDELNVERNQRGVSNGALPIQTGSAIANSMYAEFLIRVCACHCGCYNLYAKNLTSDPGQGAWVNTAINEGSPAWPNKKESTINTFVSESYSEPLVQPSAASGPNSFEVELVKKNAPLDKRNQ